MPRAAPTFLSVLVLLAGCGGRQAVLNPAGQDAAALATLFWGMLAGAVAIFAALAAVFVYVTRIRPEGLSRRWAEALIVGGGILFPVVVLAALLLWSLPLMSSHRAPGDGLTVEVSGEQWWWRVAYVTPDGDRVTAANEIRLPVGRRSDITLEARRVIHSFWIPNLGGKTDMIPGRVNRMSLAPTRAGMFRGQCAEYCGLSHALMAFETVTMEAPAFDAWLAAEAGDAVAPATEPARRGAAVFGAEGCGACHAVRGTDAVGQVGPDLTHFGSRHSIGAGVLPMEADALARWITQTGRVKPGVEMPSYGHLEPGAVDDLVAYLMGLE